MSYSTGCQARRPPGGIEMSTNTMPVVYPQGGTKAHISVVHQLINNYVTSKRGVVRVLEAGAADRDYFPFASPILITGVDISAQELPDDRYCERIIGDIQTYKTDKTYDIVICWYVLEHVSDPQRALRNLLEYTTDDGLIIIAVPNVWSLKGLISKFTPSWLHKVVRSMALSENQDYEPFKTYLRFSISPAKIIRHCSKHEILYQGYSGFVIKKYLNWAYQFTIKGLKMLSLGSYSPELSEFILVIRKRSDTRKLAPLHRSSRR